MHTLDFVRLHNGRYLTAPGGVGNQCVDLINVYLAERWGLTPVRLNAVDWKGATIHGYIWTPNGPDNSPELGSLVVWQQTFSVGVGPYGHIALAIQADANNLISFDQDWPLNAPCRLTPHTYEGVVGWHRIAG